MAGSMVARSNGGVDNFGGADEAYVCFDWCFRVFLALFRDGISARAVTGDAARI